MRDINWIRNRTPNSPELTVRETNSILEVLRELVLAAGKVQLPDDPTYIEILIEGTLPPFSIFSIQGGRPHFRPWPNPISKLPPGLSYYTNGSQLAEEGMVLGCHAIGFHRPHRVRYQGTAPGFNVRVHPPDGESHVVINPEGWFTAVSAPDTSDETIFIIATHPEGDTTPPTDTCLKPCECCIGKLPHAMKVIISGVDGEHACCTALNAVRNVPKDLEKGGCRWLLCIQDFCEYNSVSLDLYIEVTLVDDDNSPHDCICKKLLTKIALVDPLTGSTYLMMIYEEEIEIDEKNCCLIRKTLRKVCFWTTICEPTSIPIVIVCAICLATPCSYCGTDTPYLIKIVVTGLSTTLCLCEVLNGTHFLNQLDGVGNECKYAKKAIQFGLCEGTFSVEITAGPTYTATLFLENETDEQTFVWTSTGSCTATDLNLPFVAQSPFICNASSSTLTLTTLTETCEGPAAVCCAAMDRKRLRITFFSPCSEVNGQTFILVPDLSIDIHFVWYTEFDADHFFCGINGKATVICSNGNAYLQFVGTTTTSGCGWVNVKIPLTLDCSEPEMTGENEIEDSETPFDCTCCDITAAANIPVDITITLEDSELIFAAYGPQVDFYIREVGGIDFDAAGSAEVRTNGAPSGDFFSLYFTWMGAALQNLPENAQGVAVWKSDLRRYEVQEIQCNV